ncbi:MAG: aminotransferase class I/II-fold pyridoxal phosphate-dependent enzyme [candidate division Zixibacteria bacterium]|nr:aminotransferase class I/II-fold pyridoxal phosphate-dependent enzyme [candidate division Zixibacteria bacterium]
MKLTLEKRTVDSASGSTNYSNIKSIKKLLGSQNKIESNRIGFFAQPNKNLLRFFKSFIGPGDEVLTVGPTNENVLQTISSCDASYFEFYEKPMFLPDLLGLVGKVTTRTKMIVMGNPNKYTGVVYSQREIEHILNVSENIIVVLDESTFESSQITSLDLIDKYENVALIRTITGDNNDNNDQMDYIISSPAVINNINNNIFDISYGNSDLDKILNNLKSKGSRLGRIKDARQEMLYLSIRLRMFDLNCFLNPDYSFVIKTPKTEEVLSQLNKIGVKALDLACYPGLAGNVLIPFALDIDAISIINIFEAMANNENYNKPEHNRLTAYKPLETATGPIIGRNHDIVSGSRIESNMVF